ncbi:MAG: SDR family NAD(P)-dependent oxidoreductase [Alphaproteobacteria bacterium]|nr:SDR family NAD(P)-dependent oxidoreductase [Alphaproteobacteria bacterium]
MNLNGKIFVVTGAGSGIGRELTLQLIAKGATVAAADYNEQTLAETKAIILKLAQQNDQKISCHIVDISKQEQVKEMAQDIIKQHGNLDGLINNAGIIQPFCPVEDLSISQMEHVFNVNWWGAIYMIHAFLPTLKTSSQACIINISSMGGYMPFPGQVIYGASKAAIKLMTEGLAVELADTNVNISVVYPGAVQTNISDSINDGEKLAQAAEQDVGLTAERAAQDIIKGIEKQKTRILIGTDSKIIDKLYRLMPVTTARLMSWLMKKFTGVEMPQEK